ncbi:hypothetical protein CLV30_102383 [Haloactinopolyspora alba]|uniref:Uncharacterized protein n=1 Tax=Haloactinopolyspora alba TaxID=648780 RepID=A0A2P8EC11_9ACTN|nr:hypothetical protein CLV30_102383 [Haloactinopolyspora alba]
MRVQQPLGASRRIGIRCPGTSALPGYHRPGSHGRRGAGLDRPSAPVPGFGAPFRHRGTHTWFLPAARGFDERSQA